MPSRWASDLLFLNAGAAVQRHKQQLAAACGVSDAYTEHICGGLIRWNQTLARSG